MSLFRDLKDVDDEQLMLISPSYTGYLLIGPTTGFDDEGKYCGPDLGFGSCDAGGKKDT